MSDVCGCPICVLRRDMDAILQRPLPVIDDGAALRGFIERFPLLSALDLFCNRCGRPMALSYGEDRVAGAFYGEVFCHGVAVRVFLSDKRAATGEMLTKADVLDVVEAVRGRQ